MQNNFDFVRLVAAMLVLVGHQYLLAGLQEPRIYGLYSLGDLGVAVFFSISGFLVAKSWHDDPSLPRFAARRVLRIWPALAVVVALSALALGPLVSPVPAAEYFSDPLVWRYLGNMLLPTQWELPVSFLPGRTEHTINGSLWTIALELACYVGFAVAGALTLMRRRWFLALLLLAATGYYTGLLVPANWAGHPLHRHALKLEFVSYFAAGTAWFFYRRTLDDPRRALVAAAVIGVLHVLALLLGKPLLGLWLAVPFTVLAFGLRGTPWLRRSSRFGDLSYGIYLYAFPVQQTLLWLWHGKAGFGTLLAACTAVTLLLAMASWHLVEKRALRHKPRRPRTLSPAAVPAAGSASSSAAAR